jgi:hypothetical protein
LVQDLLDHQPMVKWVRVQYLVLLLVQPSPLWVEVVVERVQRELTVPAVVEERDLLLRPEPEVLELFITMVVPTT